MKKRIMLFFLTTMIMSVCAFAQSVTVSGTVVSAEDNEPIIGASVMVTGTTTGTITDFDGKFTLPNVKAGSTLQFSYVGMKTKTVKATRTMNVVMESDAQALEEVVVTAMGIQRQAKAIGYATAKVDAEQLTQAKGSNAAAALSGKVSGLQINTRSADLNGSTRVTLRGARSFTGSNGALLVLDGVVTPMSFLQSMNPNDIDNISVLKGASAAALYGSEAANGVLIVTSKTGAKGKPSITYSLTSSWDKVAYLPKMQNRFGAGHLNSTTGLVDFDYYESDENQQYGPEFDGLDIEVGSPMASRDGGYLMLPFAAIEDGRTGLYQTGTGLQHDLSFSSSDDRGSMYLSYQHLDSKGTKPGDSSIRQTLRFNASRNWKNIRIGAKTTYTHTTYDLSNNGNDGIYEVINMPANVDVRNFKNWKVEDGSGANPNEWINDYYHNPWAENETYRRAQRQDRLQGTLDFDYNPFKWLKLTARAGLNLVVSNSDTKTNAFHYSDWAKKNIYYASKGDILGAFSTSATTQNRVSLDFMAQFNKKLNDDFELKGMIGYNIQDRFYETKTTSAGSLAMDGLFNVANKLGELGGSNSWNRVRKTGLFGSVDVSYKDWAFLQVTGRNDWTSLLDPSHWSFFYPSANASVVLTDAIPALKSNTMNHWKIRFSAAKVGTVNVSAYALENTASATTNFPYGTLSSFTLSTTQRTKDLEPEFTTEYEIGSEWAFLNNRINLEAAAYIQTTTNQTVSVAVPTSTGFSSRYINAGTMRGKGLEFDLKITPLLRLGDFRWNVSGNLTLIDTRVIELAGDATELSIDGSANYAIVGEKYPQVKATDWKRDPATGKVIVNKTNGMPSAGDVIMQGTTEPTLRMGLSTNLAWKSWSLGATFDYRTGHKTRFGAEYDMLFTGASYLSASAGRQRFVFPHSVYQDGTDANGNPIYVDNENITIYTGADTFWNGIYKQGRANQIVSAASWRLRELTLNYEVPSKLLKKVGFIQKATMSLVGRNLFMWTPKTNIWGDPDFSSSSYGDNVSGLASTGAAGTRSYGFNILVSF